MPSQQFYINTLWRLHFQTRKKNCLDGKPKWRGRDVFMKLSSIGWTEDPQKLTLPLVSMLEKGWDASDAIQQSDMHGYLNRTHNC